MKKRLLSMLLALALLAGLLPVTAAAGDAKLYGQVPIYLGYPDLDYMAEEILKGIDLMGKNDRERIRAVYDWIILNCARTGETDAPYFDVDQVLEQAEGAFQESMVTAIAAGDITLRIDVAGEMGSYDSELGAYLVPSDSNFYVAQFASEMMLYRVGNCAHYAALLTVLLNHLGYDCRIIEGSFINSDGSTVEHKWNMVLLGDQYYWLDPRMDDAIHESTGQLSYTYFLVGDTAQWEKKHEWDHSYSSAMMESAALLVETYGLLLALPGAVEEALKTWSSCSAWAEPYLKKSLEKKIYPEAFVLADMTQDVTRAEFASVAVLFYEALSGKEAVRDAGRANPFTDLTADDADALTAYQLGIVTGMEPDKFSPDGTLTRAQAATMLGRVMELVQTGTIGNGSGLPKGTVDVPAFADANQIDSWAKHYVDYFVSHGAINGMDGSFLPAGNMTREQAMKVVVEALGQ